MSGIGAFEKTLQSTQQWVNDVAKELSLEDKHQAFLGLRATLQVLRNRLTIGEAANLGSELPILLAGFYYEGWKPEANPTKIRTKQAFLGALTEQLHHYFQQDQPDFEVERLARAVFRVMAARIPAGEMEDVTGILSAEIKELFPEAIRT